MKFEELSPAGRAATLAGIVIAVAIVLLLLAEGAVRLRANLKNGTSFGVEDLLYLDPQLKVRIPRAGAKAGPISINSLGFRGAEISRDKPPGTIRLAFLGGSTTYCAEVSSDAAAWPAIVTDRLQKQFPNVKFDYVNAGVPGYGVGQMSLTLDKRVAQLRPDVIVIYEATNDLSANSFQLATEQGVIRERPDMQRLWLSKYSLLVRLVELNLEIRARQANVDNIDGKIRLDLPRLVRPFESDLEELVSRAKTTSPVVAVATFATQYRRDQSRNRQLDAAQTSLYYMPYMTVNGLLDSFDAYNRTIVQVADREGVILIGGELEIPGDRGHFTDSVHFTDAGSRAMADRVFKALANSAALRTLVDREKVSDLFSNGK
jgi:lysophospholipase L1-like esterase